MDVQSDSEARPALAALGSIAYLELEEGPYRDPVAGEIEVLTENRFLAARDGMDTRFLKPVDSTRIEVRATLEDLIAAAGPHAEQLGCPNELQAVSALAVEGGAVRAQEARFAAGDHRRPRTAL